MPANDNAVYWCGKLPATDDFGHPYQIVMYDAQTIHGGRWANMTETSFRVHGVGRLGLGFGQKYMKQKDGRWLKVEG